MMAKRRRGSCSKGKSKVMFEGKDASIDRISMLPDALLVTILSFLTFKESVATCLLSRRWRYMWTLVPKLDFDGFESLMKVKMVKKNKKLAIHEERSKYVRWVDNVIALHKSCAIEEFRVYFNLNKHYEKHIEKWVNYALARKVKRLELDLTGSFRPSYCCTSPFIHSMGRKNSILFKYLEKISLNHVNVNGESLEFFLRNCSLLQHVSVTESSELLSLKIIGPFPSLEHLEIIFCHNLNYFEIRDANLVSLKFMDHRTQHFVLKNVPLLVEIYMGGYSPTMEVMFMSSGIIPQLEKFRFKLVFFVEETKMLFYSAVKMSNLKQMTITIVLEDYLLTLADILHTSPCLEMFVLEIPNFATARGFKKRELQKVEGSYTRLKEVKIRGYCGTMSDLEFVMHLLENADALEKIVVDPRRPFGTIYETFYDYKSDTTRNRMENKARSRAKEQLVGKLPPRINLHIL